MNAQEKSDKKLARSNGGNTAPVASTYKQSRTWCFTLNVSAKDDHPRFDPDVMNYLLYGWETAPTTGQLHAQGYVEFHRKISSLKKIQTHLHPTIGAHLEIRRGTQKEAIDYCKKDGDFVEHGERMTQGVGELKTEVANIVSGKRKLDDILVDNTELYTRNIRCLDRAEELFFSRQYRTHMTRGIWYYGPTGTGKSHRAYTEHGTMDEIYTHKCGDGSAGWWDGYRQQRIVVINDFRGNIPYGDLLQLVDKWPYSVSRRGRAPIPFTSELVIITSPLTPEQVYKGVLHRDDNIAQLLRRFEVIRVE